MVTAIGFDTVLLLNGYRDISNGFVLAIHHSSPPSAPPGPDNGLTEKPGTSISSELAAKAAPDNIKMVESQSAFMI